MKRKKKNQREFKFFWSKNKFLLLAAFIFLVGKISFSYDYVHSYDPITFNISAEYVKPVGITLDEDNIDLGEVVVGTDLENQINYSTGMIVEGPAGASIIVSVPSAIVLLTNGSGSQLMIQTRIDGGAIILDQNGNYSDPSLKLVMTSTDIAQDEGYYAGVVTVSAQTN